MVSQLTLRRQHDGQETLVTLSPRAADAFITAENHDEAREAIFGTPDSPVYIADPRERDVAYSVFMAEVYNLPGVVIDAPRARTHANNAPPRVIARPTQEFIAEIQSWVRTRSAQEGVARERYEEIGGDGGELRSMASMCAFGAEAVGAVVESCTLEAASETAAEAPVQPSAYAYRLGAGETLASVTLSSNFSLIETLSDQTGYGAHSIAGAMAFVAHAVNRTHDEAGIGTGSEVLVVSFADPDSSARRMLDAFLARPSDERTKALQELALSQLIENGVFHAVVAAPLASPEEVMAVLAQVEGDASQNVATRKSPNQATRDLLEQIARAGSAPAPSTQKRVGLASSFDRDPAGPRSLHDYEVEVEALRLGLIDDDRLYAQQRRSAERFVREMDAIGERHLEARLAHRRRVAEEIERAEIAKA